MGRRPKSDAIRRAHQTKAMVIEPCALPMPAEIADNELMRECWEWTVGDGSRFTRQHIPMLMLYSMWWAVARQCIANSARQDGRMVTKVQTPMGERRDPDIGTLQIATTAMRSMGAELGISPLAQQRMGLMQMATVKLATDIPERVFKMLDEHHGD